MDADSISKLKTGGMQVDEPTPELKAGLEKIGDTVIQEWIKKAGQEGKDVLAAYRASLKH